MYLIHIYEPAIIDSCAQRRLSLIRAFADHMCLLEPPGYAKRDSREPLPYWVDVQADLRLYWLHRSYCRFCRALAQIFITLPHRGFIFLLFVPGCCVFVPRVL